MAEFQRSIRPAQDQTAATKQLVRDLRDKLLEAIGRWKGQGKLPTATLPGNSEMRTDMHGMVHKTAGYIEEIFRLSVDIFLERLKDRAARIESPLPKAGMGEFARTLKRLAPLLNYKAPENALLVDSITMNWLDDLVTMRNDLMHKTLRNKYMKARTFIETAEKFCRSKLVEAAVADG